MIWRQVSPAWVWRLVELFNRYWPNRRRSCQANNIKRRFSRQPPWPVLWLHASQLPDLAPIRVIPGMTKAVLPNDAVVLH